MSWSQLRFAACSPEPSGPGVSGNLPLVSLQSHLCSLHSRACATPSPAPLPSILLATEGTVPESGHLPFVRLLSQASPWPAAPGSPSRGAVLELWSPMHKASRTAPAELPPHYPLPAVFSPDLSKYQPFAGLCPISCTPSLPGASSRLLKDPAQIPLLQTPFPMLPPKHTESVFSTVPGQPQQDTRAWVGPRSLHGCANCTPGHSRNPR